MRLLLIRPGGPVLQIQIKIPDIMHRIPAAAVIIIVLFIRRHTSPGRILICQRHMKISSVLPICQLASAVFNNFLSILPCNIHIPDNIGSCASWRTIFHVDIDSSFFYTGRIEIMGFVRIRCCRNSTAADRNYTVRTRSMQCRSLEIRNIHRPRNGHGSIITCHPDSGYADIPSLFLCFITVHI